MKIVLSQQTKKALKGGAMSILLVSMGLLAELSGVVFCLVSIALGGAPWLAGELQAITLCVLFGGLGGCTYCLRGVYLNACVHKRWDIGWWPWYVIRPVVSLVFGGVGFLFIKSGLMLLGAAHQDGASQLGLFAVAFLAGFNVDKFVAKIETVGHTVWGVEPSRQSKASGNESGKDR